MITVTQTCPQIPTLISCCMQHLEPRCRRFFPPTNSYWKFPSLNSLLQAHMPFPTLGQPCGMSLPSPCGSHLLSWLPGINLQCTIAPMLRLPSSIVHLFSQLHCFFLYLPTIDFAVFHPHFLFILFFSPLLDLDVCLRVSF